METQDCSEKQRVWKIWRQCRNPPGIAAADISKFEPCQINKQGGRYHTDSFYPFPASRGNEIFFGDNQRQTFFRERCVALYKAAQTPTNHFERLDEELSNLLTVDIKTREPDEVVVEKALSHLARLPTTPPRFTGCDRFMRSYHKELRAYCPQPSSTTDDVWDHLEVVSSPSTNTILAVLNFNCTDGDFWRPEVRDIWKRTNYDPSTDPRRRGQIEFELWSIDNLVRYTNVIAELLETSTRIFDVSAPNNDEQDTCWFIVKSFLWSSWQRSVLLVQWFTMEKQMKWGCHFGRVADLFLRGTGAARDWAHIEQKKSNYMCNWAYELLKTDRFSGAIDLRHFHTRFNDQFGYLPPRCLNGKTCNGKSPKNCQRFVGAIIENQSTHRMTCNNRCSTLYWDEQSYRSVSGARAASDSTLSISHVWSHGQGGRPEKPHGMNYCLHQRYVAIAKDLGCDSYWMDTPCIPEDHELRQEAITNINTVFHESKVTLVCDKDLLEIDISNMTLAKEESVLATILVCDWNVRAWTFLEALRGRSHIYILFRNDKVKSFLEIFKHVYHKGRIDLAVLFLNASHLLPPPRDTDTTYPAKLYTDRFSRGFVSVEEAAGLLSHRQASRPGDDVVIWSLLVGEKAYHSPVDFWRSRCNQKIAPSDNIHTGYLISSAPRIQNERGLRWAPAQPTCVCAGKFFLGGDGHRTRLASLSEEGLKGSFGVNIFRYGTGAGSYPYQIDVCRFLQSTSKRPYLWVALLQALLDLEIDYPTAYCYRGNTAGSPLFGVCVSNDGNNWVWKGVFEWNPRRSLPEFHEKEIMLV